VAEQIALQLFGEDCCICVAPCIQQTMKTVEDAAVERGDPLIRRLSQPREFHFSLSKEAAHSQRLEMIELVGKPLRPVALPSIHHDIVDESRAHIERQIV